MCIFRAKSLSDLKEFNALGSKMGIVERTIPVDGDVFFQELMKDPLEIFAKVRKGLAHKDISEMLDAEIPDNFKSSPFFYGWVNDMAELAEVFCDVQDTDATAFSLGTHRGCRRYHVDKVPMRMIVTYAGKGTEWLPENAVDRQAYENGEPNDKIVLDESARQFVKPWEAVIFRGGSDGVLHRTPDDALDVASIFMRLDPYSFWEEFH